MPPSTNTLNQLVTDPPFAFPGDGATVSAPDSDGLITRARQRQRILDELHRAGYEVSSTPEYARLIIKVSA